jgi:hypothetical protein
MTATSAAGVANNGFNDSVVAMTKQAEDSLAEYTVRVQVHFWL